ncbi:MAG: SGNH/GDSL hydrolase family protein [Hyphomicrobiales bacterium]|nr:SGNH/GDSL hydrolase family protein [Hyphomicrobiales bacterium]
MARKIAGPLVVAGLSVGLLAATGARAEDAPALSAQCQAPAGDIAAPAPLPNFAAALAARKKVRVLAIGSSSTYGIGASSKSRSYPAQLHDILQKALAGEDVDIVNRGVSGEVASTTAERLRSEVAIDRPDLVLWQLGTNDALSRVPPDQFEQTVRSTIGWLKADKIDVVLVGLQYTPKFSRDQNYTEIRDTLFKIASEENVLYIRRFDAMRFIAKARATPTMMSSDDFHLNDLGYRCMAEHIAQAVIANLFVRRFRPAVGSGP